MELYPPVVGVFVFLRGESVFKIKKIFALILLFVLGFLFTKTKYTNKKSRIIDKLTVASGE